MIFLLALIGLIAVVVLVWKAFGPHVSTPAGRVVGPDDDPEFLWKMNRDARRSDGTDPGPSQKPE